MATDVSSRVLYAQSVHDEAEAEAVLEVLRSGPTAFRPGPNVAEMERQVAALFGKPLGLMCNSGSSALYLAIELLGLEPGDEIITSPLTFSTDIAPIVRAGLVPVFADVEADTFNVDVAGIESLIGPRTKALLFPNLVGNVPDWDAIRAIADRRGLLVIEDSCDALGATLHGTPTGVRAHISVTSFAMSHIITCAGNGGMVLLDSDELRDQGLMLRRWGRRSEKHLYGTTGEGRVFREELDGLLYDNDYIFDVMPWNFEPSEMGAAFGLQQLRKLDGFIATRQRHYAAYRDFFAAHPEHFTPARQTAGLDTAWLCYPFLIEPASGISRSDLQEHLDRDGVDSRPVWTGNVVRQPMMRGVAFRQPDGGLPNADRVMEFGLAVSNSHGMTDAQRDRVIASITNFIGGRP